VRQLLPLPVDPVDPAEVYGELPAMPGRPGVRLNMIASVDGATTVEGVSGGLGGEADRRLFMYFRSLADVVLVAAGTVRAERYGPPRLGPELLEARRRRGQAPLPRIAVVSRGLALNWGAPLFSAPSSRPIVVTVADAPAGRRAAASEVADVVVAGEGDVDLALALSALGEAGVHSVVSEGGPTLGGQLVDAGLVDELCLTISPRLVGGDAKRILAGPPLLPPRELRLSSLCEEDGFLFLRLRPAGS
jgi:riboflavin biosynthesis pyrimidine reductase